MARFFVNEARKSSHSFTESELLDVSRAALPPDPGCSLLLPPLLPCLVFCARMCVSVHAAHNKHCSSSSGTTTPCSQARMAATLSKHTTLRSGNRSVKLNSFQT